MIDFDKNECNSLKLIVVKGNTTVDVTSKFIKGKMLFSKVLLKSFVYDFIDVFCFPTEEVRRICVHSVFHYKMSSLFESD